jgi:hypothetical protein
MLLKTRKAGRRVLEDGNAFKRFLRRRWARFAVTIADENERLLEIVRLYNEKHPVEDSEQQASQIGHAFGEFAGQKWLELETTKPDQCVDARMLEIYALFHQQKQ